MHFFVPHFVTGRDNTVRCYPSLIIQVLTRRARLRASNARLRTRMLLGRGRFPTGLSQPRTRNIRKVATFKVVHTI